MAEIRPATEDDLPAILAIYNHAIVNTTAIWMDQPADLAERAAWFSARRAAGFPVLVAVETEGSGAVSGAAAGTVLGYGSFGPFRPFDGFRNTVEHSVYVSDAAKGRGIGRMLLRGLIGEARGLGKRVMVGAIDSANYVSLALHEHMGFEETGRMHGVGEKFGRRLDMVLVQLML